MWIDFLECIYNVNISNSSHVSNSKNNKMFFLLKFAKRIMKFNLLDNLFNINTFRFFLI